MNKIPNWLRYILAIPAGVALAVVGSILTYISNRYVSDPHSWNMVFIRFVEPNIGMPMFFIVGIYVMLPNYKKVISGSISIILALICIAELFLPMSTYNTFGVMASAVTLLIMAVILPKDKDENEQSSEVIQSDNKTD